MMEYASQINRQTLGVWLEAKVKCKTCGEIISTGTMSKYRLILWAYCPKCQKNVLVEVVEMEKPPEETASLRRDLD
jgi:endogenous inhibitor of DNA gyrase (YacG/DUF329 family)